MSGSSCMKKMHKRQGAVHGLSRLLSFADKTEEEQGVGWVWGEGRKKNRTETWLMQTLDVRSTSLQPRKQSRASLKEDLLDSHSKERIGLKLLALPPPCYVVSL